MIDGIAAETPALLLHLEVVERNLQYMAERARRLGVSLRPHIKTHKCVELARRQLGHGAAGITVSTLFEAEVFARAGFTDITWAFPLDPTHIPHVRRIADGREFVLGLSELEATDRNSPNFQLLDDYAAWFGNIS